MRLGDCVHICSNISGDKSPKVWLLNLDMIQQQTGHIIAYNYVPKEDTNGSIVSFDTSVVLYSKLRPNLNKVVLPTKAGYATSELLPLKPNEDIVTREYLTLLLRSPKFVSYAVSKTAGAKMPRLSTLAFFHVNYALHGSRI